MAETQTVRRVAVALFEGFTVLDVYGPVQAFASTRLTRPDGSIQRLFEIMTVAEKAGPVKSGEGPTTHAEHAFGCWRAPASWTAAPRPPTRSRGTGWCSKARA
jgi:transcriptional regulator GlxA family with amidase domain